VKDVYQLLDAIEALDYSKPETFDVLPYQSIIKQIGLKFQSSHCPQWSVVWKYKLQALKRDESLTSIAKRGEVSFMFMQMFRSMLLLDARRRGFLNTARKPRFVYAGPDDEKTRDFCSARVNKAYTEHQILNWQDLSWDGKIEDGGDIFTDLGGYNCRHYLVPEGYPLEE